VLTLDSFPSIGAIEEDADSLEGNALKKARAVCSQSGLPSLADDTGLEVFYLNGQPGVFSSRYSGPGATYEDNCRKLLDRLRGVPPRRRSARFRCVLAFVAPGDVVRTVDGTCDGSIMETPRGNGGFGYDPLFLPNDSTLTFAEMDAYVKNKFSHRGKAMEAVRPLLREYFDRLR
jgi:XTP/dITP diphosphohydrolase